ncbi:MAG: hypothetical protein Q7T01_01565 [bacterium]|nr:hypothetical protein [bacterium]
MSRYHWECPKVYGPPPVFWMCVGIGLFLLAWTKYDPDDAAMHIVTGIFGVFALALAAVQIHYGRRELSATE